MSNERTSKQKQQPPNQGPLSSSFQWMKDGKSLSKNLLYTPLQRYQEEARRVVSSNDTTTVYTDAATTTPPPTRDQRKNVVQNHDRQRVPKSIQEPSFVEFMHAVSVDYHTNVARSGHPKNNGSRPISLQGMDDKIKSRAVTLVGGGINTSKKSTPKIDGKTPNRKQRRKRTWEQLCAFNQQQQQQDQHKNSKQNKSTRDSGNNNDDSHLSIDFVRKMNERWNDYIMKLLAVSFIRSTSGVGSFKDDVEITMTKRFATLFQRRTGIESTTTSSSSGQNSKNTKRSRRQPSRSSLISHNGIEIVGAHVQVESCPSRHQWTNRLGVIVGETTNTLRIAVLESSTKYRKNGKRRNDTGSKKKKNKSRNPNQHQNECNLITEEMSGSTLKSEHINATATNPSSSCSVVSPVLRTLVVPKQRTRITILLPLPKTKTATTTGDSDTTQEGSKFRTTKQDDDEVEDHGLDHEIHRTIVPIEEKSITLSIALS